MSGQRFAGKAAIVTGAASGIGAAITRVLAAEGARVLAVAETGAPEVAEVAEVVLPMPVVHPLLQPVVAAVPLQRLAYEVAVELGLDVDQPRNLAKSVTVE